MNLQFDSREKLLLRGNVDDVISEAAMLQRGVIVLGDYELKILRQVE